MKITLKTLPDATEQQLFEQVALHLLTQNRKSLYDGNQYICRYRSTDGLMCAAGCIIADDEYNPSFEGMGWPALVHDGSVPWAHAEFIAKLQRVHDGYETSAWYGKLMRIGHARKLDTTFLEQLEESLAEWAATEKMY